MNYKLKERDNKFIFINLDNLIGNIIDVSQIETTRMKKSIRLLFIYRESLQKLFF